MKKEKLLFILGLIVLATNGYSQKGAAGIFGEPILTDSLSTVFIPIRYNQEFLSSNKIALWNDYYANIIIYNSNTDSYKKLFDKDTYIKSLKDNYSYATRNYERPKNITTKWIFLLVKTTDTNKNGRIDEKDPSVLFAVSVNGQTIKQLTDETENVISVEIYDEQGFGLFKIQRDSDNDKSFKTEDKDFYYRKITLTDLTLGKEIEIK